MRDQRLADDVQAAALSQYDGADWRDVDDQRNLANLCLGFAPRTWSESLARYGLGSNEYRGGRAPIRGRRVAALAALPCELLRQRVDRGTGAFGEASEFLRLQETTRVDRTRWMIMRLRRGSLNAWGALHRGPRSIESG